MKKFLKKLFETQPKRTGPLDRAQKQFEEQARQQFLALKRKGLSIPVISL